MSRVVNGVLLMFLCSIVVMSVPVFAQEPVGLEPEKPQLQVIVQNGEDQSFVAGAEVEMAEGRDLNAALNVAKISNGAGVVVFGPKDFDGFTLKEIVQGESKTVRFGWQEKGAPKSGSFKVKVRVQAPERLAKEFVVDVPVNEDVAYTATV